MLSNAVPARTRYREAEEPFRAKWHLYVADARPSGTAQIHSDAIIAQLPMFPNNLRPMPLKRRKPFSDPDWLFELKHDGFRALAFVDNGSCRLVSRNGNEFHSFDILAKAIPAELQSK